MNLLTIDFLDIALDYLLLFLFIIIVMGFIIFYKAITVLNSMDSGIEESRINNILFDIERKLEDIEERQEKHNLKINFIYSKCLDIWQDQHDKGRGSDRK